MTKVTSTKPKYPCNDDFVTDFETEQGPGFFQGNLHETQVPLQ